MRWPFDRWNLNFLERFAGIKMPEREFEGSDVDTSYIPDPALIHSGDTFNVMRLDGAHQTMAWVSGSAIGRQCQL